MLRRVTLERILGALWHEALAALLAAAAKDVAAGFGGHAGTEAELLFPGALGGLEGAFAHGLGLVGNLGFRVQQWARGGETRRMARDVNAPVREILGKLRLEGCFVCFHVILRPILSIHVPIFGGRSAPKQLGNYAAVVPTKDTY